MDFLRFMRTRGICLIVSVQHFIWTQVIEIVLQVSKIRKSYISKQYNIINGILHFFSY